MKDHLWSFGFKGLPKEQHFTFSKKSDGGINFHLTKNIFDPENSKKKPAISILDIDKEIISSDLNLLFFKMFSGILKEINIDEIKKNKASYFLKFDDLTNDNLCKENEQELINNFKEISKIRKKTRLKINNKWTEQVEKFTESENTLDLINRNIKQFSDIELEVIDGGLLLTEEDTLSVIKIYDRWYKIDENIKLIDIFKNLIGEKLAKIIYYKIKRSIVILKHVNSYKETENKYPPIKLTKTAKKTP